MPRPSRTDQYRIAEHRVEEAAAARLPVPPLAENPQADDVLEGQRDRGRGADGDVDGLAQLVTVLVVEEPFGDRTRAVAGIVGDSGGGAEATAARYGPLDIPAVRPGAVESHAARVPLAGQIDRAGVVAAGIDRTGAVE